MCWASLWTFRATVDRWNKGVDHFSVKVSALVQEMVSSEFSGVAFTNNPVTGRDEFVIEAIAGLGEALVSGRVNSGPVPAKQAASEHCGAARAFEDPD